MRRLTEEEKQELKKKLQEEKDRKMGRIPGKGDDQESLELLNLKMLQDRSKDSYLRRKAALWLGKHGVKNAFDPLMAIAKDRRESSAVRKVAVLGVGVAMFHNSSLRLQNRLQDYIELLAELAGDPGENKDMRVAATLMVGFFALHELAYQADALVSILTDEEQDLQLAAVIALICHKESRKNIETVTRELITSLPDKSKEHLRASLATLGMLNLRKRMLTGEDPDDIEIDQLIWEGLRELGRPPFASLWFTNSVSIFKDEDIEEAFKSLMLVF